jgi:hypothetical protein
MRNATQISGKWMNSSGERKLKKKSIGILNKWVKVDRNVHSPILTLNRAYTEHIQSLS